MFLKSCNHNFHQKCIKKEYYKQRNKILKKGEILCPICKNFSNCTFPILKPESINLENIEISNFLKSYLRQKDMVKL